MAQVQLISAEVLPCARQNYKTQKCYAIMHIAIASLLILGSAVALGHTSHMIPFFPTTFAVTMAVGVALALRPYFPDWDWTLYHTDEFIQQLRADFIQYTNPEQFRIFAGKYNQDRLFHYGLISNVTQVHYRQYCYNARGQKSDRIQVYLKRWNHYVNHVEQHRVEECPCCKAPLDPTI